MLKEFFLFIKYPYTAGVIITIWLGSALLLAINHELPVMQIVMVDMFVSVLLAFFGFGTRAEK